MGAVVAAIGAVVGGVNTAYDEGQAQKMSAVEAADNTKLALETAANARLRGARLGSETRMLGSRLEGAQNVAYSNSGVDASKGTAAKVSSDSKRLNEMDARTQENNAAAEAWGYEMHGLKFGQQASIDAARSSSRASSAVLGGVVKGVQYGSSFLSSQSDE